MKLDTPEDVLELLGGPIPLFAGHQPMPKPCKGCPFVAAEQGNDYLAPGRLDGIKMATLFGQPFNCHKTVYSGKVEPEVDEETGEENMPSWSKLYHQCAGALEWGKKFAQEHGRKVLVNGKEEE